MKFTITFKDPDCVVLFPGKDIDYVDQLQIGRAHV